MRMVASSGEGDANYLEVVAGVVVPREEPEVASHDFFFGYQVQQAVDNAPVAELTIAFP